LSASPCRKISPVSLPPRPPPAVPPPTSVRVTACPCRAHCDLACTNAPVSAHNCAHRTSIPTLLVVCPPLRPHLLLPLPLPPAAMARTKQMARRSTGGKAPAGLARAAARRATKASSKPTIKRRYRPGTVDIRTFQRPGELLLRSFPFSDLCAKSRKSTQTHRASRRPPSSRCRGRPRRTSSGSFKTRNCALSTRSASLSCRRTSSLLTASAVSRRRFICFMRGLPKFMTVIPCCEWPCLCAGSGRRRKWEKLRKRKKKNEQVDFPIHPCHRPLTGAPSQSGPASSEPGGRRRRRDGR